MKIRPSFGTGLTLSVEQCEHCTGVHEGLYFAPLYGKEEILTASCPSYGKILYVRVEVL